MSNIVVKSFEYEGQSYPLVPEKDENGTTWFSSKEVCAATGHTNSRKAVEDHVDPDDVTKRDAIDSLGRTQLTNFVNESGLYSLILSGQTDRCKAFKRHVTSEILPAIRRTGNYISKPEELDSLPTGDWAEDFDQAATALCAKAIVSCLLPFVGNTGFYDFVYIKNIYV